MKNLIAIAFSVLVASMTNAMAQAYPSRPITIIVPFPAGGPTDTLARILADHMTTSLAHSIIVENVSGAAGSIGVGRVARAVPDGYTVSIGHWSTHVVNGATMSLAYDVLSDFEPVSLLADTPIWMVARTTLPAKDLKELIAWLKQNPGKATAGGCKHVPTGAQRANQGLCRNGENPMVGRPRCSDDGRGGRRWSLRFVLARPVGAEGDAQGCHRKAQFRRTVCLG
jgi:tripartite-type tricarboxylate transporter receptor subunit TctC